MNCVSLILGPSGFHVGASIRFMVDLSSEHNRFGSLSFYLTSSLQNLPSNCGIDRIWRRTCQVFKAHVNIKHHVLFLQIMHKQWINFVHNIGIRECLQAHPEIFYLSFFCAFFLCNTLVKKKIKNQLLNPNLFTNKSKAKSSKYMNGFHSRSFLLSFIRVSHRTSGLLFRSPYLTNGAAGLISNTQAFSTGFCY